MKRLTAVVAALGAVIMMGSAAYCAEVKDAQYYFKQGNDIEWKNNRLGAIDSYTEALKLNPDYVEARVARGKLYYFTGQYAKALEDFNYFYNKPNYGPTVYYEFRINCKKKLGQYAEAVDDGAKPDVPPPPKQLRHEKAEIHQHILDAERQADQLRQPQV